MSMYGEDRDFSDAKVGDEVITRSAYSDRYRRAKIERVTKTMVVVNDTRYRRSNGMQTGTDSWYFGYIYHVTPETEAWLTKQAEKDERARLVVSIINRFRFGELSNARLRELITMLEAWQKEQ